MKLLNTGFHLRSIAAAQAENARLRKELEETKARRKRSFPGAQISRLTNDWMAPATSSDAEAWAAVASLRQRCRQLERSSDYFRRYLKLVENNVLGACGIGLQMKIQNPDGSFDKGANGIVETGWQKWNRKEFCTVNYRYSWKRVERLVLRSCVRDGSALVQKIPDKASPFGFRLKVLEGDFLDLNYNVLTPTGNEIRGGIEIDQDGRIVAFWMWTRHPGDILVGGKMRVRVPAEQIYYINLPERIGQTIGIPWAVSSMLGIQMLSGYQEAEVTAARAAACKGYFIKQAVPEQFKGDGVDENNNPVMDLEPGMGIRGNPGEEYQEIDPTHPNTAFDGFVKSVLRGIAAGLGVSYNSLANDLENVNYSSIRAGLLEEREEWKAIQEWLIEELHQPVFEEWLNMSLVSGGLKTAAGISLPASKFDKFNMPEWKPRRWAWVDPLKDVQAEISAIGARLKSRQQSISEDGGDMEDVDNDFANDPVTNGIDTDSVYAPNSKPEPVLGPSE
jgi:lambda family phage portal protein